MGTVMRFSISKAAELARVSRATFYQHIEKHNIIIEDSESGRPKVPLSELTRVYGDIIQFATKKEVSNAEKQDTHISEKIENATLRAKVKHLEEVREVEKRGYEAQLQLLKAMIGKAFPEFSGQVNSFLGAQSTSSVPAAR